MHLSLVRVGPTSHCENGTTSIRAFPFGAGCSSPTPPAPPVVGTLALVIGASSSDGSSVAAASVRWGSAASGADPTGENKESGKRDVAKSLSMRELDIDRCRIMTSIMPMASAPKGTATESAQETAQEAGKEMADEAPKQSETENAS